MKTTENISGKTTGKKAMRTPVNPYPVSVNYYRRLVGRVREVFAELGLRLDYATEVMKIIDRYMHTGRIVPTKGDRVCLVVFYTLRDEIDSAMERSRRARALAQARREARRSVDLKGAPTPMTPPSGKMERIAEGRDETCGPHNHKRGSDHTVDKRHRAAWKPLADYAAKPS